MVKVSQGILKRICYHGEKAYPEECCGALFGTYRDGLRTVQDIREIPSAQELSRDRRFLITSVQYRLLEKLALDKGFELIGFYHSHPDHQAQPSLYDREHALPWFVYLIVSVTGQTSNGRLTAWILSENRHRFQEDTVEIG